MPQMATKMSEVMKTLPINENSRYYKGGFEQKMTRREASLILGVSPTASKAKIKVSLNFKKKKKISKIYKY